MKTYMEKDLLGHRRDVIARKDHVWLDENDHSDAGAHEHMEGQGQVEDCRASHVQWLSVCTTIWR